MTPCSRCPVRDRCDHWTDPEDVKRELCLYYLLVKIQEEKAEL